MSSRDELLADLAHLRQVLAAKAARTEEMVEKLETEAKHREEERERLVLAAVKPVLKSLADADKAVAKELKLVALDAQKTMDTLEEDLKEAACGAEVGEVDDETLGKLKWLKARVGEVEDLRPLQVNSAPGRLDRLGDLVSKGVYLTSGALNSGHLAITFRDCGPVTGKVYLKVWSTAGHLSPLLLSQTRVVAKQGFRKVVDLSAAELLARGEPAMLESPACLTVALARPVGLLAIEVTLLRTHVQGSPRLLSFGDASCLDITVEAEREAEEEKGLEDQGAEEATQDRNGQEEAWVGSKRRALAAAFAALAAAAAEPASAAVDWAECVERRDTGEDLDAEAARLDTIVETAEEQQGEGPSSSKSPRLQDSPWRPISRTEETQLEVTVLAEDDEEEDGDPWNATGLPEAVQSMVADSLEASVWGEAPAEPRRAFTSGSLRKEATIANLRATAAGKTYRSAEGGTVLTRPHDIALFAPLGMPQGMFLVSEPKQNRVSIFSTDFAKFLGCFNVAKLPSGERVGFEEPSGLLATSTGFLVVTDRNKLRVFDGRGVVQQEVAGRFQGLAEAPQGDVLTLKGEYIVRLFYGTQRNKGRGKKTRHYSKAALVRLEALEAFPDWTKVAKPRHLACWGDKVFVTDRGLHRIVVVDLSSGRQTAAGYLGNLPGQFRQPSGLVSDAEGNLLVVDQANYRLAVYDQAGAFVKEAASLGDQRADVVRRLAGALWVVTGGGLVKYVMDQVVE